MGDIADPAVRVIALSCGDLEELDLKVAHREHGDLEVDTDRA